MMNLLEEAIANLRLTVTAHGLELAVNHGAFFALVDQVDRQAERIERLEQVILTIAKGTESSPPDDGPGHTHWTYPLNKGLVEEIRRQKQHDA